MCARYCAFSDPRQLSQLLKAPPEDFLDCYPISRQVNSVKFDEAEYAEQIDLDYPPSLQSESSSTHTPADTSKDLQS